MSRSSTRERTRPCKLCLTWPETGIPKPGSQPAALLALDAVSDLTSSPDEKLRASALRELSEWKTEDASARRSGRIPAQVRDAMKQAVKAAAGKDATDRARKLLESPGTQPQ